VLDLGCGDGTYTSEFVAHGAREVVGIDPAPAAVAMASDRACQAGLEGRLRFEVGDIYDPDLPRRMPGFDCVVVRGVLHHISDPERGILCAAAVAETMIIVEPNGYNPVVKILEKVSRYHVEHEERSFSGRRIRSWLRRAGLQVQCHRHFNLVPFFCPDWATRLCRAAEPIIERIAPLRAVGCGQYIVRASRG
jgi:SAM-dependent methyltransferase